MMEEANRLHTPGARRERFAVLVLAFLIIAVWAPRHTGPLDLRWDGGVYYILGTSLAEGKGYRLLNEPGDIEANQFPPLLPLIVAVHQWLAGTSDFVVVGTWMRGTYFLIYTAFIFTAYAVLRRYLPGWWPLLAAIMVVVHPQTNFLSDLCFAELPFAFATTLFVLLNGSPAGPMRRVGAGVCAVAAYLLRTIGIALLAAWVLEALLERRFRAAVLRAVVALVPIVGWYAHVARVERSVEYEHPAYAYQRADYLFNNVSYARNMLLDDPFKPSGKTASLVDLAYRWWGNLPHVPKGLGTALTARMYTWEHIKEIPILGPPIPWRVVLYLPFVIGLIVLIGVGSLLAGDARLIGLYMVMTIAALCLTPWSWRVQWERYLAPAVPFLALAFVRGSMALSTASRRLPAWARRVRDAGCVGLVIVVIAVEVLAMARLYAWYRYPATLSDRGGHVVTQRLFFYDESHQAIAGALQWLRSRARPADVVAGSMPHWIYLLTGLKAVMPPFESDLGRAQTLLDSVPVRFVVIDDTWPPIARDYTLPLLASAPERWERVYSDAVRDVAIYERRP